MRGPKRRRFLSVVLCGLVLAGSGTGSVCHAHERGGVPHSHGLAAVALSPAATGTVRRAHEDGVPHRHVIFLGVELYEGEAPSPDTPPPGGSDETQITLGLPAATDEAAGSDAVPSEPVPAPVAPADPTASPAPAAHLSPATAAGQPRLCDPARLARSGVLTV